MDIQESDQPGLKYGSRLMVTTGALAKMTNPQVGRYLAFQIGGRLPIPKHWRAAFDTLTLDLSTKRIADEGKTMQDLEAVLR